MVGKTCSSASLCALAVLTLSVGVQAQDLRLGTEFQVNSYTQGTQGVQGPAIAAEADGDFVVAWDSNGQDGSSRGIFARRFTSAGSALAGEFQVNSYSTGDQAYADVAAEANGDFVVAWTSLDQDGSVAGVFAQRFSSAGSALAGALQVNSYTTDIQFRPAVAEDADGDFIVAWESLSQDGSGWGVFARRFSSAGLALASEFQVNSYSTGDQQFLDVAAGANGDFVVAWTNSGQDGSAQGVFARRFSSAGSAFAVEFQVNSHTSDSQSFPTVAASADGEFVIAWASNAQDGSDRGVFARRFSSTGSAIASEFQVNTYTPGFQFGPAVAASADGDFVVTWDSYGQDGSGFGVFARRLSRAGATLDSEFQVNSNITGFQNYPAVAASAAGAFVVAWKSTNQDGSGPGVFAQRFAVLPVALDVDGNGIVEALTDVLLALRYVFGFRGAVLVSGAVDLVGCTRCSAAEIEAYLNGVTH